VHHPDPRSCDLHHAPLRQQLRQRRLVHVPVDRRHRREGAELSENRGLHEVSGVQDQLGLLQLLQALRRQPARTARKMRVGENCDARQR
jgi:hypothetical protein